ncbi:MAG: hypothetical protein HC866_22685 [Leptolyngbyaceae cyanobacterium RU_5_1]|nr:hypothetical protein [Leptolyngbyaceae cyanobacterium RU_5_1]
MSFHPLLPCPNERAISHLEGGSDREPTELSIEYLSVLTWVSLFASGRSVCDRTRLTRETEWSGGYHLPAEAKRRNVGQRCVERQRSRPQQPDNQPMRRA